METMEKIAEYLTENGEKPVPVKEESYHHGMFSELVSELLSEEKSEDTGNH